MGSNIGLRETLIIIQHSRLYLLICYYATIGENVGAVKRQGEGVILMCKVEVAVYFIYILIKVRKSAWKLFVLWSL